MERILTVADPADRTAFAAVSANAFGFPRAEAAAWFEVAGHDNVRVFREGTRVVGGLVHVPMGQWFGGRSVPMAGVAGVAIAPEARGGGLATEMMRAYLREVRAKGFALSTLYPATVPLYRRAGYERAGVRMVTEVAPGALSVGRDRALAVVPTDRDDADVVRLHRAWADARDGTLDRGPYVWSRIFAPSKLEPVALKIVSAERAEGYVVMAPTRGAGTDTEIKVLDAVAITERAARQILSILGDHRSIATSVRWASGAPDLFTMLLPERRHAISVSDYWMTRILDVDAAIAARGFPRVLRASIALEIDDDLFEDNRGRRQIVVEGGRARIDRSTEAGAPRLTLGIRGLAALFTGYLPASTLKVAGLLDGDDDAIACAEEIFRARAPAMSDFF
jgi:predicted acetyltransferase